MNANDRPLRRRIRARRAASLASLLCGLRAEAAHAQTGGSAVTQSLKQLSIEQLMDVEVTSVSKAPESLMGAAAAVAIVTNEDIERSGATTIPEALRFVPGLLVARQTANTWSVSSRGFSGINSQDLLVLSDTRSIYTPLFSGVFWDAQDYLMEDIARIEVIRGPGGALWGSNAVNGVINIDTKPAQDTQGGYVEAGTGTQESAIAARYGGQLGDQTSYRVFGKFSDQSSELYPAGASPDDWKLGHLGFRSDWQATASDVLTYQGDFYDGKVGLASPSVDLIGRPGPQGRLQVGVSGGNVLGRWQHSFDERSDLQIRLYYDRTHRNDPSFVDDLDTVDLDAQERFAWGNSQEITWGLSYRFMNDRNEGKGIFAVIPPTSHDTLYSGFLQDQLSWRDVLRVTIGTKLEHNDFSGFEVQPSVRAAWELGPTRTLWAAISRSVRVPTRIERDTDVDVTDPAGNPVARLLGNRQFHAEQLLAYELGHRWQLSPRLFLDLAGYHDHYSGLASLEFGTPFIDLNTGQTVVPVVNENLTDGRADGLEALVTFTPQTYWRLALDYSYVNVSLQAHGMDLNRGRFASGSTPRNQVGLRSNLDLPLGLQLDVEFRALSAISMLPASPTGAGLTGYEELDVRVGWRWGRRTQLALEGRNLLHNHHFEYGVPNQSSAIRRSLYGKVAWEF